MDPFRFKDKRVLAYCTGGVRCEKACAFLASLDENRRPRSVAQLRGGVAAYARDIAGCAEAIETVKRTSGEDTETNAVPRGGDRGERSSRARRAKGETERTERRTKKDSKKKNTNPCFSARTSCSTRARDQSHRRRVRSVRRVRATHGSRGRVQKRGVPHASARLRIVRGARDAYAAYAAEASVPQETDVTTKRATDETTRDVARLKNCATGVFCCASCAAQDAERFSSARRKNAGGRATATGTRRGRDAWKVFAVKLRRTSRRR